MSDAHSKSRLKSRPAPFAAALSAPLPPLAGARPAGLSAIRPHMVELGCLRLADPAYPGPAVLEAIARRLLAR